MGRLLEQISAGGRHQWQLLGPGLSDLAVHLIRLDPIFVFLAHFPVESRHHGQSGRGTGGREGAVAPSVMSRKALTPLTTSTHFFSENIGHIDITDHK